jgi:hypothetical protein
VTCDAALAVAAGAHQSFLRSAERTNNPDDPNVICASVNSHDVNRPFFY